MYTDSQRAMMVGVPGTPIPTQTPAIKAANTCFPLFRPLEVVGICATITTAMTISNAVVAVKYRPTPGSASNEVTIGTLTLPFTGSAIGKQYYKKVAAYKALPGGEIVLDLTSASTAGAAIFGILTNELTEPPGNIPAMVASA